MCACSVASIVSDFLQCLRLSNSMDCSLPGSSVHRIPQARIPGVGCHSLLQGIFRPRDRTEVFCISCVAGRFFNHGATREAQNKGKQSNSIVSVLYHHIIMNLNSDHSNCKTHAPSTTLYYDLVKVDPILFRNVLPLMQSKRGSGELHSCETPASSTYPRINHLGREAQDLH